jgi:hypothetical protein
MTRPKSCQGLVIFGSDSCPDINLKHLPPYSTSDTFFDFPNFFVQPQTVGDCCQNQDLLFLNSLFLHYLPPLMSILTHIPHLLL